MLVIYVLYLINEPGIPFTKTIISLCSSGLHCDAVWTNSWWHFHIGLQLPYVCRAGLRHRALQLWWQNSLRITEYHGSWLLLILLPPISGLSCMFTARANQSNQRPRHTNMSLASLQNAIGDDVEYFSWCDNNYCTVTFAFMDI